MQGSYGLSVAPMMEYTDIYFRSFARLLTKRTWLYTEMIVDSTLRHNPDSDRFLWYPQGQHPIACQLGGSTPASLAEAAKIVSDYNYDEINLNCGCPSDRVAGSGCFGAALMLQPDLVASCAQAMSQATSIPVTIKCRLGVDDVDKYEDVFRFVKIVSEESPVRHFIIHARKCLLNGLSPHQNRTIPPLRYEWVLALKRDFAHLDFSLNGGILSSQKAQNILDYSVDKAYSVLEDYAKICGEIVDKWHADERKLPSLRNLIKPVLNLFYGEKHGRKWKALVDAELKTASSLTEIFERTLGIIPEDVLDRAPDEEPNRDSTDFEIGELPEITL